MRAHLKRTTPMFEALPPSTMVEASSLDCRSPNRVPVCLSVPVMNRSKAILLALSLALSGVPLTAQESASAPSGPRPTRLRGVAPLPLGRRSLPPAAPAAR